MAADKCSATCSMGGVFLGGTAAVLQTVYIGGWWAMLGIHHGPGIHATRAAWDRCSVGSFAQLCWTNSVLLLFNMPAWQTWFCQSTVVSASAATLWSSDAARGLRPDPAAGNSCLEW